MSVSVYANWSFLKSSPFWETTTKAVMHRHFAIKCYQELSLVRCWRELVWTRDESFVNRFLMLLYAQNAMFKQGCIANLLRVGISLHYCIFKNFNKLALAYCWRERHATNDEIFAYWFSKSDWVFKPVSSNMLVLLTCYDIGYLSREFVAIDVTSKVPFCETTAWNVMCRHPIINFIRSYLWLTV